MVLLVREHERGFDHVSEFLLHDRNAFDDIRLWVGNHGEDDVLQHAVLDGVELVHVRPCHPQRSHPSVGSGPRSYRPIQNHYNLIERLQPCLHLCISPVLYLLLSATLK